MLYNMYSYVLVFTGYTAELYLVYTSILVEGAAAAVLAYC